MCLLGVHSRVLNGALGSWRSPPGLPSLHVSHGQVVHHLCAMDKDYLVYRTTGNMHYTMYSKVWRWRVENKDISWMLAQ